MKRKEKKWQVTRYPSYGVEVHDDGEFRVRISKKNILVFGVVEVLTVQRVKGKKKITWSRLECLKNYFRKSQPGFMVYTDDSVSSFNGMYRIVCFTPRTNLDLLTSLFR